MGKLDLPSAVVASPLHHHPAITRWIAEVRRQQRRGRRVVDAAGRSLNRQDLAGVRPPR